MDATVPPPMTSPPPSTTSGLAIASLICGLLGFVTFGITGIAAVITGHLALATIRRSGGMLGGRGMSIAGLVTGYLTVCIIPLAALAGLVAPLVMKQKQAADRTECLSNAKQMGLALYHFNVDHGSMPSDKLAAEIPKFAGLTGPKVLYQLDAAGGLEFIDDLLEVSGAAPGSFWYYFPEATLTGTGPDALLISPPIGKDRVMLASDGSTRRIDARDIRSLDLSTAIEIPVPVK